MSSEIPDRMKYAPERVVASEALRTKASFWRGTGVSLAGLEQERLPQPS